MEQKSTIADVKKLFDISLTNLDSRQLNLILQMHPLAYLQPVLQYAMYLHETRLFPPMRAFSEAFLAVPESQISTSADEYLAKLFGNKTNGSTVDGGGVSTFFERRLKRKSNAHAYVAHFLKVLHKFATAMGSTSAVQIQGLLESEQNLIQSAGKRSLRQLLYENPTHDPIDTILKEIADHPPKSYEDIKLVQRRCTSILMKILKSKRMKGEFNDVAYRVSRNDTDQFYMYMCYAVRSFDKELKDSPEKRRFIRMYENTTAYCMYHGYERSLIKLQLSFADSEDVRILLSEYPEINQFMMFLGSNLSKHVNGKSISAKLNLAHKLISRGSSAVVIAVMVSLLLTSTFGASLPPILMITGIFNQSMKTLGMLPNIVGVLLDISNKQKSMRRKALRNQKL